MRIPLCIILVPFFSELTLAGEAPAPHWIWVNSADARSPQSSFQHSFEVDRAVETAELTGVADFCQLDVNLNGQRVAQVEDYSPRFSFDITKHVNKGQNIITARASSHSGPAAIALRLTLRFKEGGELVVITDGRWSARRAQSDPWAAAADLGPLADEPWGDHPDTVTVKALDDYTQWKQALGTGESTDPSSFFVPAGYQLELVHSARKDEGSWVSLEFDPRGRVIIAREDTGLLRVTLPGKGEKGVRVETIENTLKECRGLLFAHGALYANANESKALYRLRDTDNDDQFDEVKLLLKTEGTTGHGRNDLALGPDGLIYAIHGDAVKIPADLPSRRSPLRKHSHHGQHGFVLRTDRDGKNWEVVTTGMRNPYGIDFNPEGEAFTYDADAEYDTGSPWYRPTRVLHLLPGADYGWRAVTRSWPSYYCDNPDATPPAHDIGKGSPTAVKFGTNSHFPAKYRKALFILDWAYGRILAVHMTPRGAGYAMRAETFLKGRPFNVTDLGFGPDGAMYVVTGGRKTQSGLYRIRFVGEAGSNKELTPQQSARVKYSAEARALRRRLEGFHGQEDASAIAEAWPHLNSPDPFLRHAARIAIEHQPTGLWVEQTLSEQNPLAALTAMLALVQEPSEGNTVRVLNRLGEFDLKKLPRSQQWIALRIYEMALAQLKQPGDKLLKQCLDKLDPLYPSDHFELNIKLSEMLVRLNAPDIVARTLALLEKTTIQRERVQYIYVLRNAPHGWTPEQRRRYFAWIPRMRTFVGGEGMPTFISRIQADATAKLTDAERRVIAPLLEEKPLAIEIPQAARNRPFVREWKTSDLEAALNDAGRGRNFERGKKAFEFAACAACHRVGNEGRAVGPDLTSVGARFSRRDTLESIINPDRVVAEQYRKDVIETADGKTIVGIILPGTDYRSENLLVLPNPTEPETVVTIAKKNVEAHHKAEASLMPAGLLNTLSEEEILDLLAYLEAGGDPMHPNYRR